MIRLSRSIRSGSGLVPVSALDVCVGMGMDISTLRPKGRRILRYINQNLNFGYLRIQKCLFTQSHNAMPPLPNERKNMDTKTDKRDSSHEKIDKRAYPIAVSTFLMGTSIGILVPIIPLFLTSIGMSPTNLGLLISFLSFTRLLVNLPLASICDYKGRRPLLILGPIFTAISLLLTSLSTTFQALLFCRGVTGVSSSAQMTAAQLYLTDISSPHNRARTFAPMSAAWNAGFAVGPAIGGYLVENMGMIVPFLVVSVSVLLVAANNYYSLPETLPKQEEKQTIKQQFANILAHISASITQWKVFLSDKNIRSLVLLHATFWFTQSGAQLTLLPLLAFSFSLSPSSVGTIYAALALISVIGVHPASYLSDKYGRIPLIIPGIFLVAASVIGLSFVTASDQLPLLVFLWGIGATLIGSGTTACMTDSTKQKERSQGLALLRSGGDLGMVLGAGLSGFLASYVGMSFAFGVNAVVFCTFGLYFLFNGREPNKQNT